MINNYLRELAVKLDLRFPTRKFAKDLDYSESAVSQYVNDRVRLSGSFIKKLEDTYGINYKEFVAGIEKTTPAETGKNPIQITINLSICDVSKEKIEQIINILQNG